MINRSIIENLRNIYTLYAVRICMVFRRNNQADLENIPFSSPIWTCSSPRRPRPRLPESRGLQGWGSAPDLLVQPEIHPKTRLWRDFQRAVMQEKRSKIWLKKSYAMQSMQSSSTLSSLTVSVNGFVKSAGPEDCLPQVYRGRHTVSSRSMISFWRPWDCRPNLGFLYVIKLDDADACEVAEVAEDGECLRPQLLLRRHSFQGSISHALNDWPENEKQSYNHDQMWVLQVHCWMATTIISLKLIGA